MTHSIRRLWLASASIAVMCAPASAQSVISFGDSLSDNGNLFAVSQGTQPPSPPYFQGRYSNGPTFTEILAGGLNSMQRAGAATAAGLPIDPNASQNYAFGGARTDRLDTIPPGIPAQIDFFQAQDGSFAPDDLVTLYGGANNIFQAFEAVQAGGSPAALGPAAIGAAGDVAASANRLAGLGAPTLVVLNLPDLGRTPQFNADPLTAALASNATTGFNTALATGTANVAAANGGTSVHFVDVQPLFSEIFADPGRFGFTNVTQGCVLVPSCATAPASAQNSYLYFDTVHPTTRGHELFAGLVTDHLTAGARAGDAVSLSEVALADRLAGESAVRERARKLLAATNAIAQGADVIEASAPMPSYGSAYVSLEGAAFDRDASSLTSGYEYRAGTLRVGADYRVSDRLLLGGAVSASQGEVDESALTYDTQSFSADLYATGVYGPAFVTLSGGVAHFDFDDFRRQTAIPEITNRGGDTNGFAASVGVEAGYAFALGALTATPTLGLSYVHFDVDGFAEDGSGARIGYGGYDRDALYGAANLNLSYAAAFAGRYTLLTARIGYEDALSDGGDEGIVSTIVGSPAQPSFAAFDDVPRRGLILGVGADVDVTERFAIGADYSVGFGDEVDVSHIGRVSLNYRF
ncbi:autotransporter domain-containing protein [Aureimonas mangrovi]|uniref:autotransporter domain-containing protein n=1 Tax=Aureimonas mangrovi TaxID=2758041 RepID=UPI00163D9418|nr:autotransporter domain-containing protein [Aureimonas mangrovi]